MEIEENTSHQPHSLIEFNVSTNEYKVPSEEVQRQFFAKHWQVIQTTIEYFIINKASINLVAFQKSLSLLVLHVQKSKIKSSLSSLWGSIFKKILNDIENSEKAKNPLISLIEYYKTVESKLKIIFTLLNDGFSKGASDRHVDSLDENNVLHTRAKKTVEKEALEVLCKLILENSLREKYAEEMLILIEAFRNSSYSEQNIISEEECKGEVLLDLQIIKKIGLFNLLENEFYEHSKNFYVEMSAEIPKDSRDFLFIVNEYLEKEMDINNIFAPKRSTVAIIEKELIKEHYNEVALNSLLEKSIDGYNTFLDKKRCKKELEIFWKFTLRVGNEALKKLSSQLTKFIMNRKSCIQKSLHKKESIFELLEYRESLISVVNECFDKNKKIINVVYNSFEELLYEEEKSYLEISLHNILQEFSEVPDKMALENEINSLAPNPETLAKYFKLFRITPSKENFIKEFEVRFCRWILAKGFEIKNLALQSQLVQMMKKEVGQNLVKKADKMMNDVWRNEQMNFHEQTMQNGTKLKCLLLSNDWPTFISFVFNVPDELYEITVEFETNFKKAPENMERNLRWVDEMSIVYLSIRGVVSMFSELEAAILLLLGKSIRPLKIDQIEASLHICLMGSQVKNLTAEDILKQNLQNLVENKIVVYNILSSTYDLNDENTVPYQHKKIEEEEKSIETIKNNNPIRNDSILIEAAIVRILKRRKSMQRNDISKYIEETIKNFKPTFEQVKKAFEDLETREFVAINRNKGTVSYIE